MTGAKTRRQAVVEKLYADAGVGFPPRQLLLRGFKKENRVEVWAATDKSGPLTHVTTYEICYASGKLGPKRREGDSQVPEGFYHIGYYNAASAFHLSMQVSYPNQSDRILGDRRAPGSAIMIHGDCASIGCISLSDERTEEIWVMAAATRRYGTTIYVHLLPSRDMAGLLAAGAYPQHRQFWLNLKEGDDKFRQNKIIPTVRVNRSGRYLFP